MGAICATVTSTVMNGRPYVRDSWQSLKNWKDLDILQDANLIDLALSRVREQRLSECPRELQLERKSQRLMRRSQVRRIETRRHSRPKWPWVTSAAAAAVVAILFYGNSTRKSDAPVHPFSAELVSVSGEVSVDGKPAQQDFKRNAEFSTRTE